VPPSLSALDARLFSAVYAGWGGALAPVALLLSAVGGGWAMLGLVPLYVLPRWRRFAVSLTLALGASASMVFLLKRLVDRQRPCAQLPGVHALCAAPTDASFPSGHACGSFTVAAFLVVVLCTRDEGGSPSSRAAQSAALVFAAVLIAWSRVYLGVHFPGDVLAGATLGAASGAVAGWVYRRGLSPSAA